MNHKKTTNEARVNAIAVSTLPSIAFIESTLESLLDNEKLEKRAEHYLQLAIDHLTMASLLIAKLSCELEEDDNKTKQLEKVKDEMVKDVRDFQENLKATDNGKKIKVEDGR